MFEVNPRAPGITCEEEEAVVVTLKAGTMIVPEHRGTVLLNKLFCKSYVVAPE